VDRKELKLKLTDLLTMLQKAEVPVKKDAKAPTTV
jgi:hypothetical protein